MVKGRAIVWGQMFRSPFGGMIWQVLHYLLPLRELGFDVWYVEDSDEYFFHPETYQPVWEIDQNVEVGLRYLKAFGFEDRFVVRPPDRYDFCYGLETYAELHSLYVSADLAINLCGSQELRDDHRACRKLVYLETDPVRNQIEVAKGTKKTIAELDKYDHLFTYGVNIGSAHCPVPVERYSWIPTVPPVVTDLWVPDNGPENRALTTIANWKHGGKDVEWQGQRWRWSKHWEFNKFISVPGHVDCGMEIAIGAVDDTDRAALKENGWILRRSADLADPFHYRDFILNSMGEFTASKEQYVAPHSGWFSDRSVCYLAAGRPVITQSTGFDRYVPMGEGLMGFACLEEALAAVKEVCGNYQRHSSKAHEISREYFEATKVIGKMLSAMNLQ